MCRGERPVRSDPKTVTDIRKLWVVHGKFYDLEPFLARHPGGEYNLLLGRGRDCTELFESVHCLSDINMAAILSKYEVTVDPELFQAQKNRINIHLNESGTAPGDYFSWSNNGLYKTIVHRVKTRVFAEDKNYKVTPIVVIKLLTLAFLYSVCWYLVLSTGSFYWAVLSGLLTEMLGFCLMHDASHGAISKNWRWNYFGTLFSCWMFWNHWLWLQHHCYGHHSYSGIYRKDPDVVNSKLFIRKDKKMGMTFFNRFQKWIAFPILMLLPNQHVGQIIQYQFSRLRRRIFGLPTTPATKNIEYHSKAVMALSFIVHIVLPFIFQSPFTAFSLISIHYTMMGISYFLCVAPNHDQLEQHLSKKDGTSVDWGEHQIRNSGDHSTSNSLFDRIVTNLWGSMNYQIEHHLFPSVSHWHMPKIAPIVREACKEFNVPYNADNSWVGSMISYHKFVTEMSH